MKGKTVKLKPNGTKKAPAVDISALHLRIVNMEKNGLLVILFAQGYNKVVDSKTRRTITKKQIGVLKSAPDCERALFDRA